MTAIITCVVFVFCGCLEPIKSDIKRMVEYTWWKTHGGRHMVEDSHCGKLCKYRRYTKID